MLCIKVPVNRAEKTKRELMLKNLLDSRRFIKREGEFVFFPVTRRFDSDFRFVKKDLGVRGYRQGLKSNLSERLTKPEFEMMKRSMDVIGSVAILEIPRQLEHKQEIIASQVLASNKHITTVLRKGKHEGTFRTQRLLYLGGVRTKETVHKENGVQIKLDVERVYFSPRLSTERLRVAQLVQPGEKVLVLFSGCAPYVCVIAKNSKAAKVDGIEINPDGHRYALENLKLNKISNSTLYLGDASAIAPKLGKYDRILMPLPKSAEKYLDLALSLANTGATIHFYDFQNQDKLEASVAKVKLACERNHRECDILGIYLCGQNAPRSFRVCIDARC